MTKCDKCLTGLGGWSVPELLKQKLGCFCHRCRVSAQFSDFSGLNSKHDSTTNGLKITKNRWIQRDRSGGRTNFPARSTYFSPLWSPFCPYTSSGFTPADRCHSSRLSAIPPLPLYLLAPLQELISGSRDKTQPCRQQRREVDAKEQWRHTPSSDRSCVILFSIF